jgi:hypothetical protein
MLFSTLVRQYKFPIDGNERRRTDRKIRHLPVDQVPFSYGLFLQNSIKYLAECTVSNASFPLRSELTEDTFI